MLLQPSAHLSKHFSVARDYLGAYLNPVDATDKRTYRERILALSGLPVKEVPVAFEFDRPIDTPSIALHYIYGMVYYNSRWWDFSTSEFIDQIQQADRNPGILGHAIIVDSPGGEIFLLHEAAQIIRSLEKPSVSIIDRCGCSAAYWLASAAKKIYATSPVSVIGSIGIMTTLWDDSGYYEKKGIVVKELYATNSKNKNKRYNDALQGKSQALIKQELDPLMALFESDVRAVRKKAAEEVFTGESYYAPQAMELGLIDGVKSASQAIDELYKKVNTDTLRDNINSIF